MSKQFWVIVVVVVAVLVGVFTLSGNKNSSSGGGKSNAATLTNHVEGKGTTGVTLVEYGDYQCPFCGQYFPTVENVVAEYGDRIKFQFRNFPLTSVHQNAFASARAAEAAGLQNKFWEMNGLLYQGQSQWSSSSDPMPIYLRYAQQLGLNINKFKSDYGSSRVNDLINADEAEGNKLGIQGTPTFFLDGKQIQVNNSLSGFEKLINAEIAKKAGSQSTAPSSSGTTSQTAAPAKQ